MTTAARPGPGHARCPGFVSALEGNLGMVGVWFGTTNSGGSLQ